MPQTLFFIALVVVCPLMMVFMMRGGMGRKASPAPAEALATRDAKIADLERQVDLLRGPRGHSPATSTASVIENGDSR